MKRIFGIPTVQTHINNLGTLFGNGYPAVCRSVNTNKMPPKKDQELINMPHKTFTGQSCDEMEYCYSGTQRGNFLEFIRKRISYNVTANERFLHIIFQLLEQLSVFRTPIRNMHEVSFPSRVSENLPARKKASQIYHNKMRGWV